LSRVVGLRLDGGCRRFFDIDVVCCVTVPGFALIKKRPFSRIVMFDPVGFLAMHVEVEKIRYGNKAER
jgi:hypothetical protein